MLTHGPPYFKHTTQIYSSGSDSVTDRNGVPVTPLNNNYQPGPNTPYGSQNSSLEEATLRQFLSHSGLASQVIVTLVSEQP